MKNYLKNWKMQLAQIACIISIAALMGENALIGIIPLVGYGLLNFAEGLQKGLKFYE